MIKKLFFLCALLLIHPFVFASDYDAESTRKKVCIISTPGDQTIRERVCDRYRLESDVRSLGAFAADLQKQAREMIFLQKTVGLEDREHFTSDEHDKIARLLFRYLMVRESLWDRVCYYSNYRELSPDPEIQTKGFIVAFNSALQLTFYSSRLVATFIDEPAVIEKLNESYYRYNIPEGTYDKLFLSVTNIENIEAIRTSWQLFTDEEVDTESRLARIIRTEPVYRDLVEQINRLYADSDIQIRFILEKESLLLPDVRNRLRHTAIAAMAKKARAHFSNNLYAAQSVLFERVSSLKTPFAEQLKFTPDQLKQIKSLLQPGDIILTFTDGYMSNIFLPGIFKHGITYVGSPEQRRQAGLIKENFQAVPAARQDKLICDISCGSLPGGDDADLIEAVAEGVIFNSLALIANTHLTRLVVLRPRLTSKERTQQLLTVFQLVGNNYDFDFDFNNASSQCCTEVIYRSLHRKGNINFSLVKRMGKQTLSADDIVDYYYSNMPGAFDFVLLAKGLPSSKRNQGIIVTGAEGEKAFCRLMENMCPGE